MPIKRILMASTRFDMLPRMYIHVQKKASFWAISGDYASTLPPKLQSFDNLWQTGLTKYGGVLYYYSIMR